jgi:hypothetical protein
MDDCIHAGVSATEPTLPGRLGLRRRAPTLYRRLMRGYLLFVFSRRPGSNYAKFLPCYHRADVHVSRPQRIHKDT